MESELLKRPDAAKLLSVSMSRLAEIEKEDPQFPKAVWLGPRGKRYVRQDLVDYVRLKTDRPAQ